MPEAVLDRLRACRLSPAEAASLEYRARAMGL
jgi:hypothetical protein